MIDAAAPRLGRREAVAASLAASTIAALPARAQPTPGVKIGVIGDMSSTYADVAGKGSVLATTMAAEDFGGTVLGGPVTVVSADALNKPDLALSLARQWWDAEGGRWCTCSVQGW